MEVNTSSPLTKRKGIHSEIDKEVNGKRPKTYIVESPQANDFSEEESKLLSADYWLSIDNLIKDENTPQFFRDERINFYKDSLVSINEAYAVVRKTTTGIIEVLRDKFSMLVLFHFGFVLRRLHEYSCCLREIKPEIRACLSKENKLDGSSADVHAVPKGAVPLYSSMGRLNSSAKLEVLEKSGKGRCLCNLESIDDTVDTSHTQILSGVEKFIWEVEGIIKLIRKPQHKGISQFSIKIHNILLILKEILAGMGIDLEAFEGNKKDVETIKVTDNMGGVTATGNLCFHCGNNLIIDSEVLKAEEKVKDRETAVRSLIDNHFSTFLNKYAAKGFVKRDDGYTDLIRLVEAGLSHLMTGINQEVSLLEEMIKAAYASFARDTVEFRRVLACGERKSKMDHELCSSVLQFSWFMSRSNKEFDMAFRNIVDLIEPAEKWAVWSLPSRRYCFRFQDYC